jgi:hypothetical protein
VRWSWGLDSSHDFDTATPAAVNLVDSRIRQATVNLLADMGVTAGDDERVDALLDGLLARQQASGRFESVERLGRMTRPEWGSMRCETNVITDLLLRFGRGGDERVQRAVKRLVRDSSVTPQGRAWQCVPDLDTRSRGIGRGDLCPQVTLEGLRALSHLPASEQPNWIEEAVRTPLEVWRRRVKERPYAFGHGYQFKSVKWPNFWYDVLWLLETLGRFPRVWRGSRACRGRAGARGS